MKKEIWLSREPFMVFHDVNSESNKEIGIFDYKDGKWFFDGDMDESARLFIKMVIKSIPSPPEN